MTTFRTICAKQFLLMYCLESVQVNPSIKLKTIRQILKLNPTFIERRKTTEDVFMWANAIVNQETAIWSAHRESRIVPMSAYSEQQRRKLIISITNARACDYSRNVCIDSNLQLIEHATKQLGSPRRN